MWRICLTISVLVWLVAVFTAVYTGRRRLKNKAFVTPARILMAGTFLAAAVILFPLYFAMFEDMSLWSKSFKAVLSSVHHAVRLFIMDCDFETIVSIEERIKGASALVYSVFASALYIVAPMLTFGFIISFFDVIVSYKNYLLGWFKDLYVFSELNEGSLTLAKSISASKKPLIVFTNVKSPEDEDGSALRNEAESMGAICFEKDILSINFHMHSKNAQMCFFAIGEDEDENVRQTLKITGEYGHRENSILYLFSSELTGEIIMSAASKNTMKVHRVNKARSMVYSLLYEMEKRVMENKALEPGEDINQALDLFNTALPGENGRKHIGTLIIGTDPYSVEMLKALSWFCQMEGYTVSIDVFTDESGAESRLGAMFPELLDNSLNGNEDPGEAQYVINIRSEMKPATAEFEVAVEKLTKTSYVFVSTGSDKLNVETAMELRRLFERNNMHPMINAVIRDSEKKKALERAENHKQQTTDIIYAGDTESCFTEQVICKSQLEADALKRHMSYTRDVMAKAEQEGSVSTQDMAEFLEQEERKFWAHEYNYNSSMASALHFMAKLACGIAGADKKQEELSVGENNILALTEHKRWNAYMRSEGYRLPKDGKTRDDLAKTHPLLVSFYDLPQNEKDKDTVVAADQ